VCGYFPSPPTKQVMCEIKTWANCISQRIVLGHEPMKIVGIREYSVELEGDYSGGTHNVCQKDWMPIDGVLMERSV